MSDRKQVTIWTDGACLGNPGPGGFAAVLLHGAHRKELTGGRRLTTNNRMELLAAIVALRALKVPCQVTIHSDARYVVDGVMNGWMRRWRAAGWRRGGAANPNADLWQELFELCEQHEVTLLWVPGHTGEAENERCDLQSVRAAAADDLPPDEGYEQPWQPPGQPTLFSFQESGIRSQPAADS
jgi:ribonuclease HI